ncbi:MATE family efflux transporter [Lachnoanaerobaculum sp. OBRC5-5]|uniref:MATE family efflux transporter n=1 Tax=Lachnoanaerobaculum sp. OBRC5-5 TaxID=936595 RepID=UPI0002824F8F|nr:MATE family efflux transporter [Lachnoanaerobaculum sp. OBRC5-5]EJZ71070.1 MATE efflux family protein [Lachnoanaerobaculum sp. OBRC5-5]
MYTATKGSSSFNKDILRLAVPIVLQNIVTTAVNSADVIMLGFVGQDALSAGSLANQVMFILNLVYTGISSGVIMLAAQYWGKKDTKTIEHIMGIGMQLSMFISSMFFIMAFFFPHILMRIFTNDINLITSGIPYLRMVSFSYLFMSFSQVYLCAMRSIERVHFSTVTNAVALILNIIFNAVFIFGLFGAPKLGILGVALATVIARGVEFTICVIDNFIPKAIHFHIKNILEVNKILFFDFMKYSLPAFGNEIVWGVAFSMYSVIMGHLDSDIVAANAVVVVARNLGTVACFGIADAGAIILGKSIGSGNTDTIKSDSSHFVKITSMSAVVGGIVIFLLRPVFFTMADLTPTAQSYLSIMLFINMYYIVGQAFNTAMICGVFRSGGDSKWGFFCDIIDMWCYSVPLGFISAFVLKLPPMWVYFLICTDEFVKIPFVYKHYKSYKWLKNITRDF